MPSRTATVKRSFIEDELKGVQLITEKCYILLPRTYIITEEWQPASVLNSETSVSY